MELFVFPVGHVLLYPQFSKPFHIFEARYVQMVEDSIANKVPIAIASVYEPFGRHEFRVGEPLNFAHNIVGYGTPLIVERLPDQSVVIFLEGRGKARLGQVLDRTQPYLVCEAEPLTENLQLSGASTVTFQTAHKVLVHWLYQHIQDAHSRDQFLNYVKTPEQVIGCFASYLVKDPDLQQVILESDDINEKVIIINRLIQSGELVA